MKHLKRTSEAPKTLEHMVTIWNIHLQHAYIAITTYATYRWNTWKHMSETLNMASPMEGTVGGYNPRYPRLDGHARPDARASSVICARGKHRAANARTHPRVREYHLSPLHFTHLYACGDRVCPIHFPRGDCLCLLGGMPTTKAGDCCR
jgi:hypothetical protein